MKNGFSKVFAVALFLILTAPAATADPSNSRVITVDKLGEGRTAIDDIGNFDMKNDSFSEVPYGYWSSNSKEQSESVVYVIDKQSNKERIFKDEESASNAYYELYDIEGQHNWDSGGDRELFLSGYFGAVKRKILYMIDSSGNKDFIYEGTGKCHPGELAYGPHQNEKKLFYYCPGSHLFALPRGVFNLNSTFDLYRDSWSPALKKSILVSDIDDDKESEFVGILKEEGTDDDNLVWYEFYNSTPNYLGVNALELMDESYDVDHDGWQEVAYVTPQNNISWIDVNKEERVTNIKAEKLGGVGNWDDDGFKEMSFIDPKGNVKILELYQMLGTKDVLTERLGLSQKITVKVEIDNNRRKDAVNLSVKDRFPDEFESMASYGSLEVNITGPNSSETVDAPLIEGDDTWTLSVSHLNSSLLSGLEPQENISLSYSIITPNVPGRYRLPQAEIYWEEF